MNEIKLGWIWVALGIFGNLVIVLLVKSMYSVSEPNTLISVLGLSSMLFFVCLIVVGSIMNKTAPDFILKRYKED